MTSLDTEQRDAPWRRGGEKLKGRVAFVTGGTRGSGAAICESLGNQQATVAAGCGHNIERAKAFADDCEKLLGVRPSLYHGNVASAEDSPAWRTPMRSSSKTSPASTSRRLAKP